MEVQFYVFFKKKKPSEVFGDGCTMKILERYGCHPKNPEP
jgi:hypothetical protein